MALRWYATAPIFFANVRAFNAGEWVPDSIVAAHSLASTGPVAQVDVDVDDPAVVLRPLLVSDLDTDEERELILPSRLSVEAQRAAFVARTDYIVDALTAGVTGDGVTDDGPLIQQLLDALPEGGTLYLPPPPVAYMTKQTIHVPTKRALEGADNSRWNYTSFAKTVINAGTPFDGNAIIKVSDETVNSYGEASDGVRLKNLTVVGYALPWTTGTPSEVVHGFFFEGLVRSITLENLTSVSARGNGFRFSQGASTRGVPRGFEATRLRSVDACRWDHFYLAGTSDSTFTDCLGAAGQKGGWYILNTSETKLVACRSLFTAGHGFHIDGTYPGTGLTLVSPSTDRNKKHGLYVTATFDAPINISAPLWKRDGSDGVSAAVRIEGTASAAAAPVIIDGQAVVVQDDDDDTGIKCPRVGVSVAYNSMTRITGFTWGADNAIVDQGGHKHPVQFPAFRRVGEPGAVVDTDITARTVRKPTSTVLNNTATLAADPHLTLPVAPNTSYILEAGLILEGTTTADMQLTFAGAGVTGTWSPGGVSSGSSGGAGTVNQRAYPIGTPGYVGAQGAGTQALISPQGVVTGGAAGGTITLQFAQATAEVSDLSMLAGSWLRLTPIA